MNAHPVPMSAVPVTIAIRPDSYVSQGRDDAGDDATVLPDAEIRAQDGAVRNTAAIVLATGRESRMLSALIGQDTLLVKALARWDGLCWNVESIMESAHA